MVMDAIRLAGVTPTAGGYRIAPHLPFETFSLRLPQIGVAADAGMLRGYVRPIEAGEIELRVRIPKGARSVRTWAGGRSVRHRMVGGEVVFRAGATAGAPVDWAVTFGRR
jgi:hypothetical protein